MTAFDKLYQDMKKPLVMVVFLLVIISSYFLFDKPIAIFFEQRNIRLHFPFLHTLTALGKWYLYIVLFSAAVIVFRFLLKNKNYERKALFLLTCVATVNIVNGVLKVTFGRARPELFFANQEYGFYWFRLHDTYWSFPSGHAVTITAVAAGLSILAPRYFWLFFISVLCVTATRVFLYYHYLSDVMTGFYLSVLLVGLLTSFCKKNKWLEQIS